MPACSGLRSPHQQPCDAQSPTDSPRAGHHQASQDGTACESSHGACSIYHGGVGLPGVALRVSLPLRLALGDPRGRPWPDLRIKIFQVSLLFGSSGDTDHHNSSSSAGGGRAGTLSWQFYAPCSSLHHEP